jgi:hypothetical protein
MVQNQYDVLVAGGGLAGVAAAIAASRLGASVILIEKYGFLGGMATSGLVNPFMPYWEYDEAGKMLYDKPLNAGIFKKITDGLSDMDAFLPGNRMTFHEEYLKLLLDRMCREYGVRVLLHTLLTDVERNERLVQGATFSNKGGHERLKARVYIDATGDADLAAFAGYDYKLGRDLDGLCQPMTMCFRVTNVDWSKWDWEKANALYTEMRRKGAIKNPREDILIFPHVIGNVMHFNSTRIVGRNPVDAAELTEAEIEGREQTNELFQFMKNYVAGFENASLIMCAPQIGIRESRRIVGDYTITERDLLECVKFEDSIARGNYSIDIHNPSGTGTVIKDIPAEDYYTIPLRAALPASADNLLVAGRPISSTHEAHSSFRVMPITTCIGEGVGTAAAIACKYNIIPREVSSSRIHEILDLYSALY